MQDGSGAHVDLLQGSPSALAHAEGPSEEVREAFFVVDGEAIGVVPKNEGIGGRAHLLGVDVGVLRLERDFHDGEFNPRVCCLDGERQGIVVHVLPPHVSDARDRGALNGRHGWVSNGMEGQVLWVARESESVSMDFWTAGPGGIY